MRKHFLSGNILIIITKVGGSFYWIFYYLIWWKFYYPIQVSYKSGLCLSIVVIQRTVDCLITLWALYFSLLKKAEITDSLWHFIENVYLCKDKKWHWHFGILAFGSLALCWECIFNDIDIICYFPYWIFSGSWINFLSNTFSLAYRRRLCLIVVILTNI